MERIVVTDFGRAAGVAGLIAEYDAQADVIRVNEDACSRVRRALGDDEARRFVTCAVAHERHHRAYPDATEADAHDAARAACGVDPRYYESVLRESRA